MKASVDDAGDGDADVQNFEAPANEDADDTDNEDNNTLYSQNKEEDTETDQPKPDTEEAPNVSINDLTSRESGEFLAKYCIVLVGSQMQLDISRFILPPLPPRFYDQGLSSI